jgi:hypothetical protein
MSLTHHSQSPNICRAVMYLFAAQKLRGLFKSISFYVITLEKEVRTIHLIVPL